jgi:hypothetical protein
MHAAHLSGSQASNWSQIDFIRHYADGSWDVLGDQHVEVGAPRPNRLPSHSGHSSVPR